MQDKTKNILIEQLNKLNNKLDYSKNKISDMINELKNIDEIQDANYFLTNYTQVHRVIMLNSQDIVETMVTWIEEQNPTEIEDETKEQGTKKEGTKELQIKKPIVSKPKEEILQKPTKEQFNEDDDLFEEEHELDDVLNDD